MTDCARPGYALPCGSCDACKAHQSRATGLDDVYPVSYEFTDKETGFRWLHMKLDAPFEYEQVKKLPAAMAFDGAVFVRTGWNSDKGEVYYRTGMPAAKGLVDALKNTNALLNTPVGRMKFRSEFESDVRDSVVKALNALGEE
jgi:hypothetical protein